MKSRGVKLFSGAILLLALVFTDIWLFDHAFDSRKVLVNRSESPIPGAVESSVSAIPTNNPPNEESPIPSSPPLDNEKKFTITLPNGWHSAKCALEYDAESSYCYKDSRGDYFIVNIDPEGSEVSADTVWFGEYSYTKGIYITSRENCEVGQAMCPRGDGQLDITVLHSGGGSIRVGQHLYYFNIGNTNKEKGVDETDFRKILASFRAH